VRVLKTLLFNKLSTIELKVCCIHARWSHLSTRKCSPRYCVHHIWTWQTSGKHTWHVRPTGKPTSIAKKTRNKIVPSALGCDQRLSKLHSNKSKGNFPSLLSATPLATPQSHRVNFFFRFCHIRFLTYVSGCRGCPPSSGCPTILVLYGLEL